MKEEFPIKVVFVLIPIVKMLTCTIKFKKKMSNVSLVCFNEGDLSGNVNIQPLICVFKNETYKSKTILISNYFYRKFRINAVIVQRS